MNIDLHRAMRQATSAVRGSDPVRATAILQEALGAAFSKPAASGPAPSAAVPRLAPPPEVQPRRRWPLGEVVSRLRGARAAPGQPSPSAEPATPDGATFETRAFTGPGGGRSYKLFIPGSSAPRGLIVMLHGCKQNPDDFATGTNMNELAEAHGLAVAYPAQARSANVSNCWNWFNPADQFRDAGEPMILAGITQQLTREFGLDRSRVFVAGLSAGGAMAAVLGETYSDLFAAVGVHSGLPYQAAQDVMSAFAAMKGEARPASARRAKPRHAVRTIVFHGDQDRTVHPANADRVADAALAAVETSGPRRDTQGDARGRRFAASVFAGEDGVPAVELWRIEGAGHAWSGGNPRGSFTDAQGPDASAEMVRFFLADA